MTDQQKQVLEIASRLGADPREVELAIQLMRSGRSDLIVQVTAQRLSIRAALKAANPPPNPPRNLRISMTPKEGYHHD
jgi:hypothetical protein